MHMSFRRALLAVALSLCLSVPMLMPGELLAQTPEAQPQIALLPIASGFTKPTGIVNAGDGSGRLFILEKPGNVWVLRDGQVLPAPFLSMEPLVRAKGNEQGLLGLAFHPQFETNGRLFIAYTDDEGAVTVAQLRIDEDNPDRADPASLTVLLAVGKEYEDHNAGQLAFGPDGYLYIGIGDGGGKAEEDRNAQRRTSLLGKVLRIDVDSGDTERPYGIPVDNPFASHESYEPEIWVYGLRNPWRFSFDRATGALYIADVGLWSSEEINVQEAGAPGGRNYGWNLVEGFECHDQERADRCDSTTLTPPVWVYHHDQGCAIVGGFVYRGSEIALLTGQYVFGDFCLGTIWGLSNTAGIHSDSVLLDTELNINSFGEDESGELYVAAMDGTIFKIVAA